MLARRRQASLDETSGGSRRLRRQTSETRPRPIIAWQESDNESKQKQVEVVAKKIGLPKPAAPPKPLRSPSIKNEAALTISRRQVAERLRVGWSKAHTKEGQDKGRQNLNIFLNKSFEARPASPKTPELGNGFQRSQSFFACRKDEQSSRSASSTDSDMSSSEDEQPISVVEVCRPPSAPPQTSSPPPVARPPQSASTPPRSTPSPKPPLSASARRAAFRAGGRQRPTTSSPELPRPRLMSAPPQPPRLQQQVTLKQEDRPTSAPPRRQRRSSAKPRRGVEGGGGEVVTMVSLVSPADTEDEDELLSKQLNLQCQTPEVLPTPELPLVKTVPPPVLSLRRPPRAVTFKSNSVDCPQFRTSYPTRPLSAIIQEPVKEPAPTPPLSAPPTPKPQVSRPAAQQPRLARPEQRARAVTPARNQIKRQGSTKIPEPIQEEKPSEKVEKTEAFEEKEKAAKDEERGGEEDGKALQNGEDPDFKSAKERECWQLFKRMSSRGVSVSFETVLRGLLTPTEYRLRRSALLASC